MVLAPPARELFITQASGRAKCRRCNRKIEKGRASVACVAFVKRGHSVLRYLHASPGDEACLERLRSSLLSAAFCSSDGAVSGLARTVAAGVAVSAAIPGAPAVNGASGVGVSAQAQTSVRAGSAVTLYACVRARKGERGRKMGEDSAVNKDSDVGAPAASVPGWMAAACPAPADGDVDDEDGGIESGEGEESNDKDGGEGGEGGEAGEDGTEQGDGKDGVEDGGGNDDAGKGDAKEGDSKDGGEDGDHNGGEDDGGGGPESSLPLSSPTSPALPGSNFKCRSCGCADPSKFTKGFLKRHIRTCAACMVSKRHKERQAVVQRAMEGETWTCRK
jgi:hypothetical protein